MHDYKCSSETHKICENSALCLLCDGERLFKNKALEQKAKREAKAQKEAEKKQALLRTHQKEKKEGMGFEKRVAKAWNTNVKSGPSKSKSQPVSKPRIQVDSGEARRQPNSGAMWHSKGDIKLAHALMECKERGSTNSKGEKQITIPKEWLDKMELEAFQEARDYWYLPFAFKGTDDIYLVKPFNHEMQIINDLRQAREYIEELEAKIKELEGED